MHRKGILGIMGCQNQAKVKWSSANFQKVYFWAPIHIRGILGIMEGQNQAKVTKVHQVQIFKKCIFELLCPEKAFHGHWRSSSAKIYALFQRDAEIWLDQWLILFIQFIKWHLISRLHPFPSLHRTKHPWIIWYAESMLSVCGMYEWSLFGIFSHI